MKKKKLSPESAQNLMRDHSINRSAIVKNFTLPLEFITYMQKFLLFLVPGSLKLEEDTRILMTDGKK